MRETIRVALKDNPYPIYLGKDIIGSLGQLCSQHGVPDNVVVLSDTNSAAAALRSVLGSLRRAGFKTLSLTIPAGERQKSFNQVTALHTALLNARIPRKAALIAVGGGVVGDVGGFVASTYRRGIMFVQCPTTLLSQVDSSVGGKNGVNLPRGKNVIGSYLQPRFVLSDIGLLRTLPRREMITGLGEILKYPFVGDPSLLDFIEKNLDRIMNHSPRYILEAARRCLRIKSRLVAKDERELHARGRNLLNAGHAVGHALETLSRYRLHHGEAVFLGLIAEAWISVQRGLLTEEPVLRLVALYRRLGCRFNLHGISTASVVKTAASGRTTFVLPARKGRLSVVRDVTPVELREGLRILGTL